MLTGKKVYEFDHENMNKSKENKETASPGHQIIVFFFYFDKGIFYYQCIKMMCAQLVVHQNRKSAELDVQHPVRSAPHSEFTHFLY